MHKTCTKCGVSKEITAFGKDVQKRDGLRSHCKSCTNESNNKWKNLNPDKYKSGVSNWISRNKDRHSKSVRNGYEKNRELRIAQCAEWQRNNKEKCRIYTRNRKSRTVGKLSSDIIERLFILQRGKCACCGLPLGDNYHLDHIMPLALGGLNIDNNVQLLRQRCNNQKSAKHPVDFMRQRGFLL